MSPRCPLAGGCSAGVPTLKVRFPACLVRATGANWLACGRITCRTCRAWRFLSCLGSPSGFSLFSPTASVNCCKLDWPGWLCCSASPASFYWLYLNRRSMRRISAERTREIEALLGPGFTLHDDNAGHFLEVLRRTARRCAGATSSRWPIDSKARLTTAAACS